MINQSSIDSFLTEAIDRHSADSTWPVPNSVLTVIADRVRAALEGLESPSLEQVERELRTFFRKLLAGAPKGARAAVQGSGDPESAAAFVLGQAAFAHLLTARTLDTRVDHTFLTAIGDKRYEPYFRALLDGPKDGVTLARLTREAPETVSRKLAALRGLGLIVARQEGKRVVNKLSPAAKAVLVHQQVEPLAEPQQGEGDVERKLAELQQEAPPSHRSLPVFGDSAKKAA